jgi:hypothetical protein
MQAADHSAGRAQDRASQRTQLAMPGCDVCGGGAHNAVDFRVLAGLSHLDLDQAYRKTRMPFGVATNAVQDHET